MLLRWDLERPGQFQMMPTPMPTWDGVGYVDTVALPTARTGDGIGPSFSPGGEDCVLNGCDVSCAHCNTQTLRCEWCIFDDNYNGVTDGFDFAYFSGCFGGCYAANDPCSDANYDGSPDNCVGGGDFAPMSGCFGLTCAECALCAGPPPAGAAGGSASIAGAAVGAMAGRAAAIRLVALDEPSASDFAADLPMSVGSFDPGDTIYLEMWAARTGLTEGSEHGFGAVYADITYDPALLIAEETIPSELFELFAVRQAEGRVGGSRVGGCAPLGDGGVGVASAWVRVATVRLYVVDAGETALTVKSSAAPFGVSISGRFGDLDPSQIDFGGADVVLGPSSGPTLRRKSRTRGRSHR